MISEKKSVLVLTAFLLIAGSYAQGEQTIPASEVGGPHFYHGRQNPILRDHFRNLSIFMLGRENAYGRVYYRQSPVFLASHVDQMIDHFLQEVRGRIQLLSRRFGAARLAQIRALEHNRDEADLRQVLLTWKQALKDVAGEAGRLQKDLSYVFPDLENHSRFQAKVEGDPARADFQKEMAFLGEQLDDDARQIVRQLYLPASEQTVSVQELQRGDMLVSLDRVKKMSKKLEKALPPALR